MSEKRVHYRVQYRFTEDDPWKTWRHLDAQTAAAWSPESERLAEGNLRPRSSFADAEFRLMRLVTISEVLR